MPIPERGARDLTGDVLDQVAFYSQNPVDFTRTDPESYAEKVRLLTAAAKYFNTLMIAEFGGKRGSERERGLAEQVIATAFQTYDGEELHPDAFEKAGMLMRGITAGHPFSDANKRSGFITARYYLANVGFPLPASYSADHVIALCRDVSSGDERDVAVITARLRQIWGPAPEPWVHPTSNCPLPTAGRAAP